MTKAATGVTLLPSALDPQAGALCLDVADSSAGVALLLGDGARLGAG